MSSDQCDTLENNLEFVQELRFTVYHIILPLYFLIGVSGNITLLAAFRKQADKEKAYTYQIFLTVSKTVEIFWASFFWWGYKWHAGVEEPGHKWYMNNYVMMFFSAHVGCPLTNGFFITSLLFSVAMAADRVFALSKPYLYKSINHKKHQIAAACTCVLIGLSTSAFEVNRWHILPGTAQTNTTYIVEYNQAYLSTTLAMVLGHIRTTVRFSGLGTLIVMNVVMVVIFRRRAEKLSKIATSDRKELARRSAEKSLFQLTVYQSALTALAHIPHSTYFVAAFMWASFDICYGIIVAPFADACICIADAADFFVIISFNRKMRRAVFRVLPCCHDSSGMVTVGMATISSPHSGATNGSNKVVQVG